jgi:hypothetical protein
LNIKPTLYGGLVITMSTDLSGISFSLHLLSPKRTLTPSFSKSSFDLGGHTIGIFKYVEVLT